MSNIYYISNQQMLGRTIYPLSILNNIKDTDIIGADTETTDLDPYTLEPILIGIVVNKVDYYIINCLTFSKDEIHKALIPFKDNLWIFHNAKFDWKVLKVHFNLELKNIFCTYINHQIIYNGCTEVSHSYDEVVKRTFKIQVDKSVRANFVHRDLTIPIKEEEIIYLQKDLEYLIPIYEKEIEALKRLQLEECSKLESSFTPVLAQMELNGIRIDAYKWSQNTKNYKQIVDNLETSIKDSISKLNKIFPNLLTKQIGKKEKKKVNNQLDIFSIGESVNTNKILELVNISSPAQMQEILNKCGANLEGTGDEVLNKFISENPNHVCNELINFLLEHRKYNKLLSSFGDNYLQFINSITKKIHSNYFQNTTATGRLSCSSPNIQQVPALKEIRECFIPDNLDKYSFLNIDLSSQEIRVASTYSKDKILLASLNEGLDLHSYLAQSSFRIITQDNTLIVSKNENKSMRNAHKPIIFGALYGAGAGRISDVLNIPKNVAEKVYTNLKLQLPELFAYQELVKKKAVKTKTVRCGSKYNRIKWFNFLAKNETEDYKIEKEGCNYPIQATSASMLKLCMIEIQKFIENNNLDCQIKASVHDELIIQIPKDNTVLANQIKEIMQTTANTLLEGVVMESEMSVSNYWQH